MLTPFALLPSSKLSMHRVCVLEKSRSGRLNFNSGRVGLARPREIRTPRNPHCKLPLWLLIFLNYTKMTKYEGLEKNAVSETVKIQLGILQYSRRSRKASAYWEIFDLFINGHIG